MPSQDPYVVRILSTMLVGMLVVVAGCSEAEEAAALDEKLFMPAAGSSYRVHVNHRIGDSTKDESLEVRVRTSNMLFEGKENVVLFAADTLTSIIAFESSGDLSLYVPREDVGPYKMEAGWLRFSFEPGRQARDTLPTVIAADTFRSDQCHALWMSEGLGEETVKVGNETLVAKKAYGRFEIRVDSAGAPGIARVREYRIWFAPRIGYIVREEIVSTANGDTLGLSSRNLEGYVLK